MTYDLFDNAISSPASADGATHSGSPAGPTTNPCGPAHVPANLSARQARERGLLTSGTSGPPGIGSSASVALAWSLGSRLRQRLEGRGSTLFRLTWRQKATAAGRSYSQLVASARRTSGSGCGSWPTPNAGPQNDRDTKWMERRAQCKEKHGNNGFGLTLGMAAQMTGWPTPRGLDGEKNVRTASGAMKEIARKGGAQDINQAAMPAYWISPQASDAHGSGLNQNTSSLDKQARGQIPNGSPASTERPGQLNPALPRWLMGYLPEWCVCAVTATPSSRKSRRSS